MRTILGILSLLWKFHIAFIFLITTLIYYPLIVPFLLSEKGKKNTFGLFVMWSWSVRILCLYFVVRKTNMALPDEPCIIIANHASYLDIFLMHSIMSKRPFLFLGKSEILNYPLIKTFFRNLHIPVQRDSGIKSARALMVASREMKKGWSVVIFPEGGIPNGENPKMSEFKEGAFRLAKNALMPIVPMTFVNNHILFSDPSKILGPARPGISYVHIHPFISREQVAELTNEDLKKKCFNIINQAILDAYPEFT